MENILPGFRKHHHEDDMDEYGRHVHPRPGYGPGYSGPYEYTGQPVGFEHLGSPPKQRLEDMDAKTIAQLGYEGPEGERRKVEAINEQIYEYEHGRGREYGGVRPEYREGYSDGYGRDRPYRSSGHSSHIPHVPHFGSRRREEEDYRRSGGRYGQGQGRSGYQVPIPVTVDRKYEEDGTVVEHVYPDNSAAAAFARPDYEKIHYGRQDSFPETALQEAAAAYTGRYPAGYSRDRPPPPYAPPYSAGTSSYGRRPYEGSPSDYGEERDRRY